MFCPYCGAKNPEGASFCVSCGASLAKAAGAAEGAPAASKVPAGKASAESDAAASEAPASKASASEAPVGAPAGRRRSSAPVIIAIAALLIVALVFVGLSMMGSGGGTSGDGAQDSDSSAASWEPAPYLDAALYDEPVSTIIDALEDESFNLCLFLVEDNFIYVRMRTFSTSGAFPQVEPTEYTYVQLQLNLPEGVDPEQVASPEEIPDASELFAVSIYAAADLSEDELVPAAGAIIDGMGFDAPQTVYASNEALYDAYVDAYGEPDNAPAAIIADPQDTEVTMVANSDAIFSQRAGKGGWGITCVAQDGSTDGMIRLTYMPLY
ncbi:zinc ribbon domain-containing protein [[Collinsella] massiliensis]|uniref:zinc ribbon domain-containing protein n=1 Tax=[Collinsella] massiliensis TaxID=1232426 RepID=UPI0013A5FFE2|nr:zinc ribbon domain-containing protein [[Collinsella] massiliensis]